LAIVEAATKAQRLRQQAGLQLKEQKVPWLIASYFSLFMARTDLVIVVVVVVVVFVAVVTVMKITLRVLQLGRPFVCLNY